MKRTTLYLEPKLELLLKLEMHQRGKTMAQIVREALRAHLGQDLEADPEGAGPPGGGAFRSGRRDTATKLDEILARTGFGRRG